MNGMNDILMARLAEIAKLNRSGIEVLAWGKLVEDGLWYVRLEHQDGSVTDHMAPFMTVRGGDQMAVLKV